jgi:replicative DNA helicase
MDTGEPSMTPEESVIGACLLEPASARFAADMIEPEDFELSSHTAYFRAIMQLINDGEPVEPMSVHAKASESGHRGLQLVDLYRMQQETMSAASITFYAEQVKKVATRRRMESIATKLMSAARDETIAPSQAIQMVAEAIKDLHSTGKNRMTTKTLEEILAVAEDHDWLIPDLLERGDRLIITGFEGGGKTTWVRQLVICMAAGIHPTTLNMLDEPLTVLVVDAENTEAQWRSHTRGMVHNIHRMGGNNPAPRIHIHAKGRIDITRDATLGEIHRLVDEHEPQVLAIGPIYKMVSTGINNDQEAAPVITALDSLRDRGLALIMEGHSPKGTGANGQRDMSPRGSAALLGWPEFGFGMYPDSENPQLTNIQRWRGDRETGREWPRELWRGGILPWSGDTISPRARAVISQERQDHHARYN